MFGSRVGFAVLLAVLCLGGRTAHAQAAAVNYWIPGWPFGLGANLTGQSSDTYGNFPSFSFDGSDARGGRFSYARYNFSNGWFVGSEAGGTGFGVNGFSQASAFSNIGSLNYQGVQFGYNFQSPSGGGLPITLFAGVDTLNYNTGSGNSLLAFDNMSNTTSGYSAHAGVEYRPTSNLSLSVGVGVTQMPGAYR
jgi:opacity protein-like surface antigen